MAIGISPGRCTSGSVLCMQTWESWIGEGREPQGSAAALAWVPVLWYLASRRGNDWRPRCLASWYRRLVGVVQGCRGAGEGEQRSLAALALSDERCRGAMARAGGAGD